MSRLVVPISIKAVTDTNGVHTFEGLAATWQQDLGNDVITKGAFKKTIADWKSSGDALPLLNSHDSYDIFSAIGQLIDAQETKDGLWTKWVLLPGEEGDRVFTRIQPHPLTNKPTVGKMSIGYCPVKFSYEQPEGTTSYFDQIRHLDEVDLEEVSLVLFPMNEGATIDASTVKQFMHAIKSADPTGIDGLTRHQLRELSGRIGNLLKKQKDGDDPKTTPPKPKDSSSTAPSPLTLASSTPTDEESEELDIARELLDEEEAAALEKSKRKVTPPAPVDPNDDNDDDSGESSPDSDVVIDPRETNTPATATKDDDDVVPIYVYSEALQHRLRALKIQRIASGSARDDDTTDE